MTAVLKWSLHQQGIKVAHLRVPPHSSNVTGSPCSQNQEMNVHPSVGGLSPRDLYVSRSKQQKSHGQPSQNNQAGISFDLSVSKISSILFASEWHVFRLNLRINGSCEVSVPCLNNAGR